MKAKYLQKEMTLKRPYKSGGRPKELPYMTGFTILLAVYISLCPARANGYKIFAKKIIWLIITTGFGLVAYFLEDTQKPSLKPLLEATIVFTLLM